MMPKNIKLVTTCGPTINKSNPAIANIKILKKVKTLSKIMRPYDLLVGLLAILTLPTLFIYSISSAFKPS